MNWLADNLWALWFLLALVLGGAELLTLDLTLLMVATGAAAGGLTALLLPGLWPVQLAVAVVVSFLTLAFLRPTLLRRVRSMPGYRSQLDKIVGSAGHAITAVTTDGGEVKIDGETWSARTAQPGMIVHPGDDVEVESLDGVTAVVHPRHRELR